jgi:hypothetical protein
MTSDICISLILNNNETYKNEFFRTIRELRNIGLYSGDIVLLFDEDLQNSITNDPRFIKNEFKVIYKFFPRINRDNILLQLANKPFQQGDKREILKHFQYHKFYLFNTFFKQWKKVFYIDVGMHIFKPINKMLNIPCHNILLAHSDTYPFYKDKLDCQFEKITYIDLFNDLQKEFNLKTDYFQTGILMFDTNIINENTFDDLYNLSLKYFNSKTNEQCIMNLYFNCKLKLWKQINIKDDDTFFYDMWERPGKSWRNYIMLKKIRFPNK